MMTWVVRRVKDGRFWREPHNWPANKPPNWQLTSYVVNIHKATHYETFEEAQYNCAWGWEEIVELMEAVFTGRAVQDERKQRRNHHG